MRARSEIDSIAQQGRANSDPAYAGIEITAVAGGSDRIESVQSALKHAGSAEIVLVHDAARALTPPEVFQRVVSAVRTGAEAVVPVLPMTDTVRRAESRPAANWRHRRTANEAPPAGTQRPESNEWQVMVDSGAEIDRDLPTVEVLHGDLDRSSLRRVQTPQGFSANALRRAHGHYREELRELGQQVAEATDDAGLVERLGIDVVAVDGDEEALKITYPLDLVVGEHIARERDSMNRQGERR